MAGNGVGEELASAAHRGSARYLLGLGLVVGLLVSGVIVPFTADPKTTTVASSSGAQQGDGSGTGGSGSASDLAPGAAEPGAAQATSAGGSTGGAAPRGAGSASNAARRPAGQGVSGTEIKLGVALLDLATVRQIGLGGALAGTTPQEAQEYYRYFIDEVNRAGGINGRRVVPTFTTFDPTDPTTARRACLALTEDAKVFAAVIEPGYFGDPVLCFTEEHGTPTMEYSAEADEWYRRSRGLLFTPGMTGSRNLRSLVQRLDAAGTLKGKKLGVVSTDSPTEKLPVDEGLLPALKAAGYSVAYRSTISQSTDQQPSQIPVEISQMRRAQVDYLIWVSNALVFTQWAQSADGQGYRPGYAMTDINSASNDFTVQNVPATTSAVAITAIRDGEHHAQMPEAAKDRVCRERYEQAKKARLERGGAQYQTAIRACGWVELFALAARAAGADLTPQSFSQAMQRVGRFDFPYFAPGAFAPGKFDLADQVRTKVFKSDCRCWMPTGDFQPGVPHS